MPKRLALSQLGISGIVAPGIPLSESSASLQQIGFLGHQKEVEMILHEDIRMQLNPIKLEIG
ncbi:MAG: hypothetical protein AMJ94_13555 [Deltaproteobacteria bacterium SM23_61]|nr:MAG: hypothetical protein AMJ94_13555 [Deltaproteobacteria bacterium SM23_61]